MAFISATELRQDGKLRFQIELEAPEFEDPYLKNKIADLMADDFFEKYGNEIMGKFDQQAIANIAIAKVANRVAAAFKKKNDNNED